MGAASGTQAAPHYSAEIRRTAFGVPHIKAQSFGGLGYGQGYAFAQDNLCMIADHFVTLRGERTAYFGTEGTAQVAFSKIPNVESDAFFRTQIDMDGLRAGSRRFSKDYASLVNGFIAGYNRYLRDTPSDQRPVACRNAAWVKPVTFDDFLRLNEEKMIQGGSGRWIRQVIAATPPAVAPVKDGTASASISSRAPGMPDLGDRFELGSNAWAFGRDVTANRSGVLLGNPHFPWDTTNRFYESQLTLPGRFNAMGVTLFGVPGVAIGFNHDVAWSHTVSTDRHFTLFELALDPKDPTRYLVDGKSLAMEKQIVTLRPPGAPEQTRTLYRSIYGPVVVAPPAGLLWTSEVAYAVKDANHLNTRSGDTWLRIARSRSVADIRKAIDRDASIPWVNTIAADRQGNVMYADVTSTPDVSLDQLKACAPPSGKAILGALARLFVLDGSRSECRWKEEAGAGASGLTLGVNMPHVIRTDYVANSNDSFWLANGDHPLTGFSPLIGEVNTAQNLRTRAGLIEISDRLKGKDGLPGDKVDPTAVETMLMWNRNLAAELNLVDLLAICAAAPSATLDSGKLVDLAPACTVLGKWDRRMNPDSRGAHLFQEFWRNAEKLKNIAAMPFDKSDPVHTPAGLKRDETSSAQLRMALAQAIELVTSRGVALDARWGDLAVAPRGEKRIPIHGGDGAQGVLNAQQSDWVDGIGYVTNSGSSYIQVVTFDAKGPVTDAVLTYSQSTDPASPHYADQTALFSRKLWLRLPYHEQDIRADKSLTTTRIRE